MSNMAIDPATGTVPGQEDRPMILFHHLGRRAPRYRWWRPVVGTAVLLLGILVILLATNAVAKGLIDRFGELPLLRGVTELVYTQVGIVLVLPLVLAVTRGIGARPAGTVASVTGRLRWGWLGLCLTLALPATVLSFVGTVVLGLLTVGAPEAPPAMQPPAFGLDTLAALVVSLAVLPAVTMLQVAAEEFACRGWILQAAGGFARSPWLGISVQAVVFSVLHGLHGTATGYLYLMSYAIILGWLAVATGGIEAGIALHLVANCTVAVVTVLAEIGAGMDLDSTNASTARWQASVAQLICAAAYVAVVCWVHRSRSARVTPPAPAAVVFSIPTQPATAGRWPVDASPTPQPTTETPKAP